MCDSTYFPGYQCATCLLLSVSLSDHTHSICCKPVLPCRACASAVPASGPMLLLPRLWDAGRQCARISMYWLASLSAACDTSYCGDCLSLINSDFAYLSSLPNILPDCLIKELASRLWQGCVSSCVTQPVSQATNVHLPSLLLSMSLFDHTHYSSCRSVLPSRA